MPRDDSTLDQLQEIAGPLIRGKIRRLLGKAGLREQDGPDLEQEVWAKLWPRLRAYDSTQGRAVLCEPPPDVPMPPGVVVGSAGFPTIPGNLRQLREVTDDTLAALLMRNDPPTLFQRGGVLTRLRICQDNVAPLLEPLTDSALRGVLARVANWLKARSTKEGTVLEDDAPPLEVVKDLATLPDWPNIPVLEAVVETPVFTRRGELLRNPGFHPDARLWYHPAGDVHVPDVPLAPSPADLERARYLLLTELLGDFPFADDASRAHALAALLLPFVRAMIDGPTPLHLFDAPVEGTGKTLLASCLSEVCAGRPVEAIAEASDDEEWRKRITAVLVEGSTIILLDNLTRILDSEALASVLTSRVWKDPSSVSARRCARRIWPCGWPAATIRACRVN